jgi:D-sedoheptulose 7-phosphate isomerase
MSSERLEIEGVFRARISASIAAKQALLTDLGPCLDVAEVLVAAYRAGGGLLIFGNGGSASDAQHIAAEFVGQFYKRRPALRAIALSVNTSALTAIANDVAYSQVFARQVEAHGRRGDVVVGITTSGNSENVVEGLRRAREMGLVAVALTGRDGGRARGEADFWVGVAEKDVARIQEAHILIGHVWSELVERALFPDAPPAHDSLP